MRIRILGSGPLGDTLAKLAERGGHSVQSAQQGAADLVILAGSRAVVTPMVAGVADSISEDAVVIDATTPDEGERGSNPQKADTNWISAALRRPRVVRAFASLPTNALAAVLQRAPSGQPANLAVPLAGDDRQAKELVESFMRDIGVEPFDLGAMTNASVLDPGGALWAKALNPIEMLEKVGWLSGDG